jgi:hypothetical protein
MPAARSAAKNITTPTAVQIFAWETPSEENAGRNTVSVIRPRAIVTAIEATANRKAPMTDFRKGLGCARM